MPVDQDEERDYSPEALKQRERSRRLDDEGAQELAPDEQAKLDQIEAGLREGDETSEPGFYKGKSKDNKEPADDGEGGGLYKRGGQSRRSKLKGKLLNRKTAAGGGITGLIIAGVMFLLGIGQGPLQLVHFSQLLSRFHFSNNTEFNNNRSARRFYHLVKGDVQNSRLGVISNKVADKIEVKLNDKSGLKSVYGTNGRFIGFEVLDDAKARGFLDDMKRDGIDVDGNRNGRRFVDLSDINFRERRSTIRTFTKAGNIDGIAGRLSSRLLIRRAGVDFHPLKNIRRKTGDSLLKYYQDHRKERNERIRDGVDEDIVNSPDALDVDTDDDGVGDTPDPGAQAAEEAAEEIIGDADIDVDAPGASQQLKKSLLSKFAGGAGGAAAVVGTVCTLRGLGEAAETLQYTQTILPMIRTGMMFISVGAQVQAGQDLNMEEVGALAAELYDESDDGNPETVPSSAFSAMPLQAELGQELNGVDISPHLKPGKLNEKPAFFRLLDDIPGIDGACDVNDFIGGLPVIKQLGEITGNIVASVLPIDKLVDGIVGWLAGKGMDYTASGGPLGAIAMYGSRLAANSQSAASGGLEMDGTESIALAMYNQESIDYDFNHSGFLAKAFDIYDARSVVSQMAISIPRSSNGLMSAFVKLPSTFVSSFTPKAFAQSSYDYGFNEVGFTVSEMNNEAIADPYENAEYVEQHLQELNEKYGQCFNMTVETIGEDDIKINNGDDSYNPYSDEIKEKLTGDCQSDDLDLLRYRAYLADAIGASAEACYEGVDEAKCADLGFGLAPGTSAGSVDCSASVGNEKIVCAAQNYLGIRYANNDSKWANTWGVESTANKLNGGGPADEFLSRNNNDINTLRSSAFIDCSGFTNLALYAAFGYKTSAGCSGYWARDENGDSISDADPNLKIIPMSEVRPGDFLTISLNCDGQSPGHIGIFAGLLPDGRWSTLESSAGKNVLGEQTSGFYEKDPGPGPGAHDWKYAVRYIGPGSTP